jgi:hypothetical protein
MPVESSLVNPWTAVHDRKRPMISPARLLLRRAEYDVHRVSNTCKVGESTSKLYSL